MTLPNITVEAAFGFSMFDDTPVWEDISSFVRRGSVSRGRPSVDGRFGTGTGSLTLDNRNGEFSPENTASTFFPDVTVGVPIRITHTVGITTYPIFYGSARGWPPDYPKTGDSTVTVALADGFYNINLEDLATLSYGAQSTDGRINAVLDDIGWPAGLRDLDAGVATVQPVDFAQPGDGGEQPALPHLLDVAESEVGTLFMARDGSVAFRNRIANSGATSAFSFTDSHLSALTLQYNDDFLYNDIRLAREDGLQVTIVDAASVATHGRRVLTRDVMPMGNDAEVLSVGTWLSFLFGEQRLRIESLIAKPLKGDASLLPVVLGLELRNAVNVTHIPSAGDTINQLCAIEAITHEWVPGDWTTVFALTPLTAAETSGFFTLDVSLLDGTDVLV